MAGPEADRWGGHGQAGPRIDKQIGSQINIVAGAAETTDRRDGGQSHLAHDTDRRLEPSS